MKPDRATLKPDAGLETLLAEWEPADRVNQSRASIRRGIELMRHIRQHGRFWRFTDTRRTLAELLAPGFFRPLAPFLGDGDVLLVTAADGRELVEITKTTSVRSGPLRAAGATAETRRADAKSPSPPPKAGGAKSPPPSSPRPRRHR